MLASIQNPNHLLCQTDSTLRKISQWGFIIKSDLTKAFYQIPLEKESMKYWGIVTSLRGMQDYTRCAMGMPKSEMVLKSLCVEYWAISCLGGGVTKLTDDLYWGGNTAEDLHSIWHDVLSALSKANLRLSVSKTVICPRQTSVFGWIWSYGALTASLNRIVTLSSCERPQTIKGLCSFIWGSKPRAP